MTRIAQTAPAARCISKRRHKWLGAFGVVVLALLWPAFASAQEMEPRSYSPLPVGTNFVVASYARSSGDVSLDPSLPITGLNAIINIYSLGYSHSFGLAGHAASFAVLVPYATADLSGNVFGMPAQGWRSGLGDTRFRVAVNLLGGPALTPEEFARRNPTTSVGVSLSVVAPTGQYQPSRVINVGSNRWAFKPELGLSQPAGNWFVEGAAGVWLYTENTDFYGGTRRSQAPLAVFQSHVGYNFRPGLWIAADMTYYAGGQTTTNAVQGRDQQSATRYGLTLSVPFAAQWSAKFAWSRGLTVRIGGNFQTFLVTLQYRWVNH